jgi:hypothetical protein
MLGVTCGNRDGSRFNESRLAPNIGLKAASSFWLLAKSEMV